MPIITAQPRPPKNYAVQATMKNHQYLENLFKDCGLEVQTIPRTGQRIFHLIIGEGDQSRRISAPEGDYFMWLEGTSDYFHIEYDEFHKEFEVTGTYDTVLG